MIPAHTEKPWFRQFWPWFLIALPSLVILACLYTVYLALHNPLSLVKKDYYQEGLTINKDLGEVKRAQKLGLHSVVNFQTDRRVAITISHDPQVVLPPVLTVDFIHPVDAHKDVILLLTAASGSVFVSPVLSETDWQLLTLEKNWYVHMQPANTPMANWLLQTEIHRE